jgi:hypothetical protein
MPEVDLLLKKDRNEVVPERGPGTTWESFALSDGSGAFLSGL